MTRTLDSLVPGDRVTLLNPQPYDNLTGVVTTECYSERGWAGGWAVSGLSKYALEFQGWLVCEDVCGDISDDSDQAECLVPAGDPHWWHWDGTKSWKSDQYGDSAVLVELAIWKCPLCSAVMQRYSGNHNCPESSS